jgi:hypothetical protein
LSACQHLSAVSYVKRITLFEIINKGGAIHPFLFEIYKDITYMATEDRLPAEILKGNTVVPIEQLVSTSPLKHWRIAINDLINFGTTLAPENHASSTRIYGIGNKETFGHLKLVDKLDLAYDVLYGAAITPNAVKTETDKCLHIGVKLDKTNVDSIDGKLLFGDVIVDTVTADTFTGFLEGTAKYAINDEKGNNIIQHLFMYGFTFNNTTIFCGDMFSTFKLRFNQTHHFNRNVFTCNFVNNFA